MHRFVLLPLCLWRHYCATCAGARVLRTRAWPWTLLRMYRACDPNAHPGRPMPATPHLPVAGKLAVTKVGYKKGSLKISYSLQDP